jgi:hypothetical protein
MFCPSPILTPSVSKPLFKPTKPNLVNQSTTTYNSQVSQINQSKAGKILRIKKQTSFGSNKSGSDFKQEAEDYQKVIDNIKHILTQPSQSDSNRTNNMSYATVSQFNPSAAS